MSPNLFIAALSLAVWGTAALVLARGSRRIGFLRDVPPQAGPKVSLVVAARNEERNLREALSSLLAQDYPQLEYVVVDDRSEDSTPRILAEMAAHCPRLRPVRVDELPPGWLGKNHALWHGAESATGEILLFTDADVVMAPDTVSRAVSLFQRDKLDHLAVTPETIMPSHFLGMFTVAFGMVFFLFTRAWKVRDPRSSAHIGIGAFNMVRRSAYLACGGHSTIRLRPDDDLKLGRVLKMRGFRQEVAYGTGLVRVEWYASLGELVRGLEKNAFAGVDYSIPMAVGGALTQLLCSVWPFLGLFSGGVPALIYAATCAVILAAAADTIGFHGGRRWYALGFPAAALLFAFIVLRTTFLNLLHGGITWRGTFYSLKELRSNRV
ncbi:MAG TPA: glycosyltransferase family 2 protein [Verrucomicrobiae bacterium]|nr:glycosyltransferase family 2 protein [Verrucomicrobiae bacterium]